MPLRQRGDLRLCRPPLPTSTLGLRDGRWCLLVGACTSGAEGRLSVLYSFVKPNTYQDSLRLMQLSNALKDLDGVDRVSLMMGTPANKEILRGAGLVSPDVDVAKPSDLIIAAEVSAAAVGDALVGKV